MNNVFHATSAHKKNEENSKVFKATSAKSYEPNYVNNLNRISTDSLNKLNDYIKRRQNNEYMTADELAGYRKARTDYADSSKKLYGIARSRGTQVDEAREKQEKDWLEALGLDLDNDEKVLSGYKNAEEYNTAVKDDTYRSKYQGKTYGELQDELASLRFNRRGADVDTDKALAEEIEWLKKYSTTDRGVIESMTDAEYTEYKKGVGKSENPEIDAVYDELSGYMNAYNLHQDYVKDGTVFTAASVMGGDGKRFFDKLGIDPNRDLKEVLADLDEIRGGIQSENDVVDYWRDQKQKEETRKANEARLEEFDKYWDTLDNFDSDLEYVKRDIPENTGSLNTEQLAALSGMVDYVIAYKDKKNKWAVDGDDNIIDKWNKGLQEFFDIEFNSPGYDDDYSNGITKSELKQLDYDERSKLIYFYNTDPEKAVEYLKALKPFLEERVSGEKYENTKKMTTDLPVIGPVLGTAASVQMAPVVGIEGLGNLIRGATGDELHTEFSDQQRLIRDVISEDMGDVGKAAYSVVTNIGDVVINSLAAKGLLSVASLAGSGTGALSSGISVNNAVNTASTLQKAQQFVKETEIVSRVLMAGSTVTPTMQNAIDRGLSNDKVLSLGLTAFMAEYITESIGVDSFLSDPKNAFLYLLKNAGAESLEEGLTNGINTIADSIIAGGDSEIKIRIRELMATQNMTEKEAFSKAWTEWGENLGYEVLLGGISGGIFGIGGSIAQASDNRVTKAIGAINKADTTSFDNIVSVAKRMPNNAEVVNALKAVDKKDSKSNVGTLTRAVYSALDTEFRTVNTIEALDILKSKYGENNSYVNEFYSREYERVTGESYNSPDTSVLQSNAKTNIPSPVVDAAPYKNNYVKNEEGTAYKAVTADGADVLVYGIDSRTGDVISSEGNINAKQLSFNDAAAAALFEDAKTYNDEVADLYIRAYNPDMATVGEYKKDFGRYYRAGSVLGARTFERVWNDYSMYGAIEKNVAEVIFGAAQNEARVVKEIRDKFRNGSTSVYLDADRKTLTARQKVSVDAIQAISRATGIKFYMFSSYLKEDGKRYYKDAEGIEKRAPNGYYDPSDSSIHIDLNAGRDGEGTMLFTVAHELTHYIKQWSESKFNILADFLLEQYAEKGVSVEALVQAQIEKAKANGRDIDYDTAFEEVIADSMESMLTDGKVAEKLIMLAEKDMSLVKKIKSYLKQLFEKIKKAYAGLNPNSREGRLVAEMGDAVEKLQNLFAEAIADASTNRANGKSVGTDNFVEEHIEESSLKYSEKDFPIDPAIKAKVDKALISNGRDMHELSVITPEQNKDINRLTNITNNDLYRGKFTGGKHLFSENAIRHIIAEHGDFLREALRAQLPMTADDIARHLSAIKDNKHPSNTLPSKTREDYPSILTSYEINGYTLYAEEIKKPLGKNKPSDLVGHTIYKAPTLPTAASYTTSVQAQPKRQSLVLCNYYTTQSTNLSIGNFVSDKSGNPALLCYYTDNGVLKHDPKAGGIIALSSDGKNFTDKNGVLEQGYVTCKKLFYISQDNRVFSNSETNVIERINDLKKQGYDCFIFDKVQGDNYMVAVVNKEQIIKQQPKILFSDRDLVSSDALFDQLNVKKAELIEETQKQKAIENSEERSALIQNILDAGATPESLEKYSEWSKRTGFDKIVERVKVLEKEVADLANSYEEAATNERKSEEEAKITDSGLSEAEYYRRQAVEEFGYTPYFYDAGYLLPDGKLLNFSGEKDQHFGMRGEDHRAIGIVYADVSGGKALVKFMSDGNIRVMAETPGIDIITTTEPTSKQYSAIKQFVREYKGERFFCVDFTDENGMTVGNYTYEGSPNPDRVVNDIKYFYENGEIREQSDISSFLYQDRGETSSRSILAEALEATAQTNAEKTRLAEYREKAEALDKKQAELTKVRAEIKELSFAKGKRDIAKISELRKKAAKLVSSINYYDKQLLGLESTKDLKAVLQREKAKAVERQKAKDAKLLERYKEKAGAQQEAITKRYQEARERSVEGRKKTELRTKIKKFKAKLEGTMLNPTDRTYVPAGLFSAMIEVCDLIDTDTSLYKADGSVNKAQERRNLTHERLLALEDEYSKLANNKDFVIVDENGNAIGGEFDKSIQDYLKDLRINYSGKKLSKMSLEELSVLYEVLSSINDVLQDAKSLIGFSEAVGVYEAADNIVAEQSTIAEQKRKDGKRSLAQKGTDWVVHKSLAPVRAAERMSGYNRNSWFVKLFNNFEKGVRKKTMFKMQAYKSFEELITGDNASEYESAMYDAYGHLYTDDEGHSFYVSKMQAMQSLLSYEREQANKKTLHIENGGLSFADVDLLSKGKLGDAIADENIHRVKGEAAVAMIEEFREMLKNDAWAQKYMKAAQSFFNSMAKDAINSTMLILKHRIVAKDSFYVPYEVDKSFVVMEITGGYDMQQTINSYGMLQEMKNGAAQPLIVTGLNNIIDRHIEQVSTVYGLAVPVRDFNKVWNAQSGGKPVRVAIGTNWGEEAKKLIKQAVADIQSPRVVKDDPFLRKVKSNYINATFYGNLSVVTKQIGSMYSARSMIRHRTAPQMLANLAYTMFNYKKISAEVDRYTASVWIRRQGLSDAEVYNLLTEGKKHGIGKLMSKIPIIKHIPDVITAMDSAVALSLWKYCKQDIAKATGKTGEALLEATAEFFDEVIENTQSMADVLHRPEIQKQGGIIGESFGMFKTDLYQMAGQLQTALGRYKTEGTKESKRALAKAAYGCLSSAIWSSLITTLFALGRYKVDPYRDDEEELTAESWLKYQGFGFLGDLAGYILPLGGGELVGVWKRLKTGESDELIDSLALTAIQDVIDTVFTVADSIKEGEMPSLSKMDKVLGKALQMFSIPYSNVSRAVKAINYHIQDFVNGEFLSFNAGQNASAAQKRRRAEYEELIDNKKYEAAHDYVSKWINDRALDIAEKDELSEKDLKEPYYKNLYTDKAKSELRSLFNRTYKQEYLNAVDKKDVKTVKKIRVLLYNTWLYAEGNTNDIDLVFTSWRKDAFEDEYKDKYKAAYGTGDTKTMEKIEAKVKTSGFYDKPGKTLKNWRNKVDETNKEAEG